MTDVAAAMGIAQLRKADGMLARRQVIAARFNQAFGSLSELQIPPDCDDRQHAWQLYLLRLHTDRLRISRAQFIEELKRRNIGASVHFIPLHIHPYYREKFGYSPESFPLSYREYQREVSLPIYSKMNDEDVQDVIDAVYDIVTQNRV
jgi:dTDP-4-amino-4,6-dideoxygalactose transaminase